MSDERDALRPLAVARVAFGAIALARTAPVLAPLDLPFFRAAWPLLGWPTERWHVAVAGLSLPSSMIRLLCIARTAAAAAFLLGVHPRSAGIAAAVLGWIVLAQDVFGYVNTLQLLCLGTLVLAVSNSGSVLAIVPEAAVDPPSAVGLVRCFVASVYAWSGIAKLNASWLSGAALAQHLASGAVGGPLARALLGSATGRASSAVATVLVELALGPLLLVPATRPIALGVAVGFHLTLECAVHPDVFGWAMIALLISFVDPAVIGKIATGRRRPARR